MTRRILFFVVMLAAFNMATQAKTGSLCVSGYVCDDRPLVQEPIQPPLNAPVIFQPSPIVLVPFQDSTGWNYGFIALPNTKTVVMPYFTDGSIFSVGMPDGWTYTVDKQGAADSKTTVIWQSISTSLTNLGYFSFKSSYSPAEASYQFTFEDGSTRNYQLFIPLSPLAKSSGYTSFSSLVPEPSSIYMSALGVVVCIVATRRRQIDN